MADAERPGSGDGAPRLRAVRGGAVRRAGTGLSGPWDLARRLSRLESQVEEAFGVASEAGRLPDLGDTADQILLAYAGLRRWAGRTAERAAPLGDLGLLALYRWWWRVEVRGLERVPARGRAVLVVNRSGLVVPYDALMVATALAADHVRARPGRPLVDPWVASAPVVGPALAGLGAVPATPAQLRRVLEREEAAVVMPEGRQACAKPWARRYRVGGFGRAPLLRTAIECGAPIVPVAVIGAEEVQPVLYRSEALGRPFGLPAVPFTPTFPWLGVAGLVPLPTKWTLHVGEPLEVAGRFAPADAGRAEVVRQVREQVRERLQGLVSEGVRRRRSVFFG